MVFQRPPGAGHASAKSAEEQLGEVVATLKEGSVGAGARLYNKAAGDGNARQRAVSLEVVQSLVSFPGILPAQRYTSGMV